MDIDHKSMVLSHKRARAKESDEQGMARTPVKQLKTTPESARRALPERPPYRAPTVTLVPEANLMPVKYPKLLLRPDL
jgi:hypothetical protein